MPTFFTPPGFAGSAELTASTGLTITSQGAWQFSQAGYNDGATFGVSLGGPERPAPDAPTVIRASGLLRLEAQNWTIAGIGNELTTYTDPDSGLTYGADRCRILVSGAWIVTRRPNPNSFNGQGVIYTAVTVTDQGQRRMSPFLLDFRAPDRATYVIQGAAVQGGAQDTFRLHRWHCEIQESATTANSNREFQSNSIARPAWVYSYSKSWQTD